jgi:hypothetical protein
MAIRKTERAIKRFSTDLANKNEKLKEPIRKQRAHISYKLSKVALKRILNDVGQKPENRPDNYSAVINIVTRSSQQGISGDWYSNDRGAQRALRRFRLTGGKDGLDWVFRDPSLRMQVGKVLDERLRREGLQLADGVQRNDHDWGILEVRVKPLVPQDGDDGMETETDHTA